VEDVACRFNLSIRTLQRMFHRYVGVSPKWLIRRYRLREAAERLASGEAVDWPNMALDFGYFDQAHFIIDFRAIAGTPPAQYARSVGSNI
jgi:transcriptional regulator GlxA family with amidase domain